MEVKKNASDKKEKNFVEATIHRYLPYWPLFALLLLISGLAAYAYLYVTTPVYEISASILIKDEKKGADDARILEALNVFGPSKIVENEIEVVRSKDLLRKLVDSLYLYAPVFEDDPIVTTSAYTTSPVAIMVANSNDIKPANKIYFRYNEQEDVIAIGAHKYSLNTWVSTPFGTIKFIRNPNFTSKALHPLYFSLVPPEKILNKLASNLSTSSAGKLSTVIYLTFNDAVPERGKDILNTLINLYNLETVADKNQIAANTLAFVENRIKYVVKELDSIENRLQRFRTEKGVVNLSEQGKLYLQTVGENDSKMVDLDMQMAMLNEVERYVRSKNNQIGIVPSIAGIRDPLLSQLLQKLFDAQVQYERLKKTIPTGNPTMVSLANEIENMQPRILENIQNQRSGLYASKSNLSGKTGLYTAMLQTIPKKEKDLLDISRQQSIKNDVYSFLLQKREETALTYASSLPDSRTIEQAYASSGPVSPKKNFVLGVALATAIMLGLVIVNIREKLSQKILFRSDIEAITNIPIVAEILRVRRKDPLLVQNAKQSAFNEQFRQLRATLALNRRHAQHKKILVTSSIPSEGKSFISNNLALSIAMSGRKVVLVDMDLRNPEIFRLEDKRGVANFLESNEMSPGEIIYETKYQNLYVVPAGTSDTNPTELFLVGNLGRLFDHLSNNFDFVIVDTPPIDPLTDAYILTEYCDATLFVIRHGFTPKAMVELLEESSKVSALKNISIVFNGIKPRGFLKKKYGYGYGYGSKKVYTDKFSKDKGISSEA